MAQSIIVTGAASGIGRAIALALHAEGHQVLAADRDADAKAYADEAAQRDPEPKTWAAFVEWALTVKEPRESHRGVLDACRDEGLDVTDLRARLDAALSEPRP